MGNRGYSGNHPRYSRSKDESYDAKEAYNKDLTASARLHYLENDRHDHESPAKNVGSIMDAARYTKRTVGDAYNYAYEDDGYINDPSYTPGMKFGYEDYRAPGGYEYENVQAMARHADMRNRLGYDTDMQREHIDMMKRDDINVAPTGHDDSMFAEESPMNRHTRSHKLRDRAAKISERSGAERGDEYDYENPRVQKLLSKANKADEKSGEMRGNMTRHIRPLPKQKVNDERSGEMKNKMIDEMIDERPDSPFNSGHTKTADYFTKRDDKPSYRSDTARALDSVTSNKYFFQKNRDLKRSLDRGDDERSNEIKRDLQNFNNDYQSSFINEQHQADLQKNQDESDKQTQLLIAKENARRQQRGQSPLEACAKSEGGSGCIKQMDGAWRVISNKTDKPWPAKYGSKSKAEAALRGYHAG